MSQFIEMFGDFHNKVQIKDVCLVVSGKSIPTKLEDIDGNNPYIKVADFNIPGNEKYITIAQRYVSDDSASYSKQIPEGSVIFAKNGAASMSNKKRLTKIRCCIDMNTMAVFPKNESILSDFLFATIEAMDVSSHVRQGAIPSISPKSIEDSYIAMPTMEEQYRYVSIAKHADKSGFDGRKSQFIEMFKDKKTNGKIADLVDTDIKSVKKSFNKDDLIEYIDISSVNAKSRTLNETTQYIVSSAPSRAQQCVQNGDILVSTVRPINRNVAVVDRDLTNLVASTGFCVLRPKDGYREYLLAIVTSDKYTDKMCDIASGGLYPAVNNSDVLSYDIFIPDKDFLNRVTQIYRQADKSGSVLQHMIAC